MKSTKIYISGIVFIICSSISVLKAQQTIPQNNDRCTVKSSNEDLLILKKVLPKKITLSIKGKDNLLLNRAFVTIKGLDSSYHSNDDGLVIIDIPQDYDQENIVLDLRCRRYFAKTIHISLEGMDDVTRTVQLRYNKKAKYRVTVTPSF
jgi:hypothetical protein